MLELLLLATVIYFFVKMTGFRAPREVIKLIAIFFAFLAAVCSEFTKIFVLAAQQFHNGALERQRYKAKVLNEKYNDIEIRLSKERQTNGRA
jgi:hypothetical protein